MIQLSDSESACLTEREGGGTRNYDKGGSGMASKEQGSAAFSDRGSSTCPTVSICRPSSSVMTSHQRKPLIWISSSYDPLHKQETTGSPSSLPQYSLC